MLTLVCEPCRRRGRYRAGTLARTYGPRASLPDVLGALAAQGACLKSDAPVRPCAAVFDGEGASARSTMADRDGPHHTRPPATDLAASARSNMTEMNAVASWSAASVARLANTPRRDSRGTAL